MKYIKQNEGPNRAQRNAAIFSDKTSGHGGSKGGKKMRENASQRLEKILEGRERVHKLFLRAGINLSI
jgi:hypothetical protein